MNYDIDSLILTHLKLAEDIAIREWRTATHALKKDDMLSLAYEGLVDAANRWEGYCKKNEYDPEAVQYFKAFASFRIRGNIRDFIRKEDWATRTLRSKAKRLKEAGQDDGLSVEELSNKTGMSEVEINKVMAKLAARPVSLDSLQYCDQPEKPSASNKIEPRDHIDTEGSAFANDMNLIFLKTFNSLDFQIQVIIALHYYSRIDLRSIADELSMSESKVSQFHAIGVLAIKDAITQAATESKVNV